MIGGVSLGIQQSISKIRIVQHRQALIRDDRQTNCCFLVNANIQALAIDLAGSQINLKLL